MLPQIAERFLILFVLFEILMLCFIATVTGVTMMFAHVIMERVWNAVLMTIPVTAAWSLVLACWMSWRERRGTMAVRSAQPPPARGWREGDHDPLDW